MCKAVLLTKEYIKSIFPVRPRNVHKGMNGRIKIVAGSKGMTGAAALCSYAAVRSGGGLVTLLVPEGIQEVMAVKLTEVMPRGIGAVGDNYFTLSHAEMVADYLKDADAVALGPGLGNAPETFAFVRQLLPRISCPLVLDADGLNAASGREELFLQHHRGLVLTPHLGEMARLTGHSIDEIADASEAFASFYAQKWQAVVVLKGASTVIGAPTGEIFVNTATGNPGMATGGCGDVLTGVVAALLGQGLNVLEAAAAGVFLHGLAGDLAAQRGEIGLAANDLNMQMPYAIHVVQKL